jgi:WD40 repeat protein
VASTDGFDVILLDAATRAEVRRLTDCAGLLASLAFSPDSTLLAQASSQGLCLTLVATGEQLAFFPSGDWLNGVTFSPDQTLIATVGKDHTARVYGLP